jgi:cytochrome c-type biogenesis protein CcmH
MLLWTAFALLTALVLWALARPLAGPASAAATVPPGADQRESTLAVYRDQLAEVEAERVRGLLDAREAEAARTEVARRMLALDAAGPAGGEPTRDAKAPLSPDRHVYLLLAVPVLAAGLYLALGSPDLPGRPHGQERHVAQKADVERLVAQVEARLRAAPDDGRGWDVVAPVYLRLGRYEEARTAFANASRLLGRTPKRLLGEAEARLLAADGVVSEATRALWFEVLEQEPDRVEPRFWLAMAKEQEGKQAEAIADYRALLARPGGDEPWRAPVSQRLAELEAGPGPGPASATGARPADPRTSSAGASPEPGGPTAADVEAAARMTPEDRERMIAGMVDGLAARLAQKGDDPAGWQRLLQSLVVLGRREEARASLAKARSALAGREQALAELADLARRLGLEPAGPTASGKDAPQVDGERR